ncbi:WAS/WASL-interacting protein family member 2b isoform X2 [Osmerus eperlanus]|uniref:WAS/WASL-interacting protein family member 2b isoform X2 n=1 Tax=Osmerus eperlanus TaxID=29151 RepID=UPI002E0F0809
MPIPPPPPPPPGGPPPPPTFSQANTKLNRDEGKGRGALLSDIHKGARLKKVGVVSDRSAPVLEKPKGGANGSGGAGSPGAVQPMAGLFQGGVPKLRPVGDGSVGRSALQPPGTRHSAPRPPGRQDDADSPPSQASSPPEQARSQRPSLPDLSRPPSTGGSPSGGMKHSSSAPPPPPPLIRRGNAPPAPTQKLAAPSPSYNREKPLPPTPGQRGPSPAPGKPPQSPGNNRRLAPTGGGSSSLAPPPPPYRQPVANGPSSPVNEAAPELPQRHNSLSKKLSSGGHTPTRGPAPPPPPSPTPPGGRPPPPVREPPGRGAAPPVPGSTSRNSGREAPPPPPPYRTHDDFESKYSFHPLDDFPPPEEYRHFNKIYPSKANRGMRGAPPLPPVQR